MVESDSGSIMIDGVDIRAVGLKQLRSQMSIIPQDPFMFSGTVRSNLDPFQTYTEPDLWRVLEAVGLKDTISGLELKLDAPVVDGGNNFSQVCSVNRLSTAASHAGLMGDCWPSSFVCCQCMRLGMADMQSCPAEPVVQDAISSHQHQACNYMLLLLCCYRARSSCFVWLVPCCATVVC